MMQSTTLTINGMSCSHCVQSIEQTLLALEGVETVTVLLTESQATVTHRTDIPREQLVEAVDALGFDAC